jgi:hypothetical protein
MTPAQKNRLLLEHGFLARVNLWLEEGGSGGLTETASELVVKELLEHWVGVMDEYDDKRAKMYFLLEIDEVIDHLKKFAAKISE